MHWTVGAAATFVLLTTGAWADVLELTSGERLEGRLKDMTATSVVIEVGGQQIRVERAKVRALYFGPAPGRQGAAPAAPVADALGALKALQSVVSAGITYRDYVPRVADAKIRVDRAMEGDSIPPAIKASLNSAMGYYMLASQLWAAGIGNRGIIRPSDRGIIHPSGSDSCPGSETPIMSMALSALWECASTKIAEVEKQSLSR